MASLKNSLIGCAENSLKMQHADGSFPPGHNGPYFDPETSVRNTAHFLFLYSALYKKTADSRYKSAAENAIAFLKSTTVRPFDKTFHCRDKKGKDKCNGLVGQAWVIEALVEAYEAFGREDCYQLAEQTFLLHPWNEHVSIWNRVEIDGAVLSVDRTFNHQLWFAMSASLLKKTPVAIERAKRFLADIVRYIDLYDDGVIFHNSQLGRLANYRHLGARLFLGQLKANILKKSVKKQLYSKSVGYHGFNLYALAVLKKELPDEPVWQTSLVNKLLAACETPLFLETLDRSEYGYFYNTAGLEIAYAYEAFIGKEDKTQAWLNRQFDLTWEKSCSGFTGNTADVNTAFARAYVGMRFNSEYEAKV